MFELTHFVEELSHESPQQVTPLIRVGIVTQVNSGPELSIVIDGRPMRCLQSYISPTVGDVVVWLDSNSRAIALGRRQ